MNANPDLRFETEGQHVEVQFIQLQSSKYFAIVPFYDYHNIYELTPDIPVKFLHYFLEGQHNF